MASSRKNWSSRGARKRWLAELRKAASAVESALKHDGSKDVLSGDCTSEADGTAKAGRKRQRRIRRARMEQE
jgi:hypothetical protein